MTNTPQDGSKKKVLWIEDDALLGAILKKELASSEFDLIQAKDGVEAMMLLKGIVPNIVMVDLILPGGMDGFDILRQMNDDARLKGIPRIVLSNLSKPSDIEQALKLGANKFMVKADSSIEYILNEIRTLV